MQELILLLCGRSIQKLRADRQLDQAYVSNALMLDQSKLDLIENGKQLPEPATLLGICCLYDISLSAFWKSIEMEVVKQQSSNMAGKAA